MPRTVEEVRQILRERAGVAPAKIERPRIYSVDYRKVATEELQKKYNVIEKWCREHKEHPDFFRGTVELRKINKEIASRS